MLAILYGHVWSFFFCCVWNRTLNTVLYVCYKTYVKDSNHNIPDWFSEEALSHAGGAIRLNTLRINKEELCICITKPELMGR